MNDRITFNEFSFVLKTLHNIFICILYKYTLIIRNFFCKFTFCVDRFNIRNTTSTEYFIIFFTECWSNMNDTRTVFCRNIFSIEHTECTFFAFLSRHFFANFRILQLSKIREKRFVFCSDKIFSFMTVNDFVVCFVFVICT